MLWSAPPEHRPGRPLILLMHGYGGVERDLDAVVDRLPAPLVAASLRGSLPVRDRWGWLDADHHGAGQANVSARAILDWLDGHPGFPSVGLLGFSQGGAMVMQLLRLAPQRFAYGVQLSGFVVEPWRHRGDAELSARRPPFFSGHGDLDDVIPRSVAASTSRWLHAHTTLTERRYAGVSHEVSAAMQLDALEFIRAHA